MGHIIDTPDNLRVGLEARRESFYIVANCLVDQNEGRMFIYASATERGYDSATIELELDQIDPLIEGLKQLKKHIQER